MIRRVLWVLLLILIAWGWHERVALQAFPAILSAYSAKEYCSCRYVMQLPADYCTGYVKQWLPLSELIDDAALRRVTASGLGRSNSAIWVGERRGCRLLPIP